MKENKIPNVEHRGFKTADAATYIGWSESFLRRARIGKTKTPGPRFKKHGKRVTYLREDLDEFLEQPDRSQCESHDEY